VNVVLCNQPYHLFEPFLDISLPIAFEDEERREAELAAKKTAAETRGDRNAYYNHKPIALRALAVSCSIFIIFVPVETGISIL